MEFGPHLKGEDFRIPVKNCVKRSKEWRSSTYGQHDHIERLHGLGRKIKIQSFNLFGQPMIFIEEGHFFEGELSGFGRRLTIDLDMRVTEYIGHFVKYQ